MRPWCWKLTNFMLFSVLLIISSLILMGKFVFYNSMMNNYTDKINIHPAIFFGLSGLIAAISSIPFVLGFCLCFSPELNLLRFDNTRNEIIVEDESTLTSSFETISLSLPSLPPRNLDWIEPVNINSMSVAYAEDYDVNVPPIDIKDKADKTESMTINEREVVLEHNRSIPNNLEYIEPMIPDIRRKIFKNY